MYGYLTDWRATCYSEITCNLTGGSVLVSVGIGGLIYAAVDPYWLTWSASRMLGSSL